MSSVVAKVGRSLKSPRRTFGRARQSVAWLSMKWLRRQWVIREYLKRQDFRGLHLGCGPNRFEEWLNADVDPLSRCDIILDATKRFPLPQGSSSAIFLEHMLEHLDLGGGFRCLSECQRVLRPGGVIRLSVPDLGRLIRFYEEDTREGREYLAFATNHFVRPRPFVLSKALVLNLFFGRRWGHQVMYDLDLMKQLLRLAGFEAVHEEAMFASSHPALCGLETDDYAHRFESIVVEATKCPRQG
jgi:predicted SAM-dependent methyltransferase